MNFWDELFAEADQRASSPRPSPPEEEREKSPLPTVSMFAGDSGKASAAAMDMRLVRKGRRPLLLLPAQPRLAAQCFDLYPAQTASARMAKGLLRRLAGFGWWLKMERVQVRNASEESFGRFLQSAAGVASGEIPRMGILAGNPAGGTQRFIILLFNATGQPGATVKAGLTLEARELIAREKVFLRKVATGTRGIPGLRASFDSPRLNAFAMEFFPGDSPRLEDEATLAALLTAWISPQRKVLLSDFPEWLALEKTVPKRKLGVDNREVHTVIQHGDFAPWNIKVSSGGDWTALDWERGRLNGIPGWDWFHYVIQTGILVRKTPTDDLMDAVEKLFCSGRFTGYAQKTELIGAEKGLLLAYLHHMIQEVKPAEGLKEMERLFGALVERWTKR